MAACVLSGSVLTKPGTSPYRAIQPIDLAAVEFPHSGRKFSYFPHRLHLKQPEKIPRLLANCRKKPTTKPLDFAISKRKDEVEQGSSSDAYVDGFVPSKHNESFKGTDTKLDLSHPKTDVFQSEGMKVLHNHASLEDKLKAVRFHVLASEKWNASQIKLCDRKYLASATNLIHYMALKSLDIEQLEEELASLGLLSLDMIKLNVLAGLNTAIQLLENFQDSKEILRAETCTHENQKQQNNKNYTIQTSRKKALSNEESLLGHLSGGRTTHIMVTVGQEATENETLIADLLQAGATIVRINCAHGEPGIWSEIIRRVRRSSQMLEMPCRILMDLAGPKLRTGSLKAGPCVLKISPKKDAFGNVVIPGQVWIAHKGVSHPPHISPDATLFIDDENFLAELEVGDTLRICDARGKNRMLKISKKCHVFSSTGFVAECPRTSYVRSGTELYKRKKGRFSVGQVVDVPAKESFVRLKVGDLLVISKDGSLTEPHLVTNGAANRIACPSGYLFGTIKPGETIAFDDGKIWGVIQGTSPSEVVVSVTHAGLKGTKLGSQKSINIPESNIRFEGLTSKDLKDLDFVASHSDMVGISFVRNVHDIIVLRKELEKRKIQNLGVVLKIETRSGFERLPLMLLEAMKCSNPLGVMIARGDLAVECGWERLADIQDEIIAVSSAAHVPVIWATQVLESLVKSGVPTRAEITDAAQGRRTSCVMLNKGKHIVEAVSTLDTVLHARSNQKKAELKPMLQLSSHFIK